MTAEPLPRIASAFDRLTAPGPRPTPAPCADCAPERDAAAEREATWRRVYGELEWDAAELRREVARYVRKVDDEAHRKGLVMARALAAEAEVAELRDELARLRRTYEPTEESA